MKQLSTGDDSTLGNWLKLVVAVSGEDCPAAEFLRDEIQAAEHGENEEVMADESQLLGALMRMNVTTTPFFECPQCHKKSYSQNDIKHRYCGHCKEHF